ncbi:hypothetical protein QJS66_02265 [Kocuria rhizophila]|nr:hypothetical protein QJS66_02265 [Kocuria rhizophila]
MNLNAPAPSSPLPEPVPCALPIHDGKLRRSRGRSVRLRQARPKGLREARYKYRVTSTACSSPADHHRGPDAVRVPQDQQGGHPALRQESPTCQNFQRDELTHRRPHH